MTDKQTSQCRAHVVFLLAFPLIWPHLAIKQRNNVLVAEDTMEKSRNNTEFSHRDILLLLVATVATNSLISRRGAAPPRPAKIGQFPTALLLLSKLQKKRLQSDIVVARYGWSSC